MIKTFQRDTFSVRVNRHKGEIFYCLFDIARSLKMKNGRAIKNAIERAYKCQLKKFKIDTDHYSFLTQEQLEYFLRLYSTSADFNAFIREIPYWYKSQEAKEVIVKESQVVEPQVSVPSVVENIQSRGTMELVKISQVKVGEQNVNAVNARDLWRALESRQDFSTWIKSRLDTIYAVENADFACFHKKMEANNATLKEYALTIESAKNIAMLERNEIGNKVRKYFIECEKQLAQSFKAPTNMVEALELALAQAKEIESLKTQAIENAPKVVAYDKLMDTHNNISVKEFGKIIGMGEKTLFEWLRSNKYLMSDNSPYQRYMDRGYFEVVEKTYTTNDREKSYTQTLITPKGQGYLSNKLKS